VAWFVRADGSRTIGLGHVMRSLAIAEAAGGPVTFVMADDEVACSLPVRRGFAVMRVHDDWLDAVGPGDRVVFDGYPFLTSGVTTAAMERGATVIAVDDHDGGDVDTHVVVNPSAVAPERYRRARTALCGPQYALVRHEFAAQRDAGAPSGTGTLLVTLGGSDATGATDAVLDALDRDRAFERVVLLVGPAARAPRPRPWLDVVRDPDDVPATMAAADAAISAAGSTTWELLCLGVPTAVIPVAENQRLIAETVRAAGAAIVVDQAADLACAVTRLADPATRARLRANALTTVDGHGARRVVDSV
jgi:spore coat polysaccharide biosynthesis predicted glycosyltransferase SpsG